MGSLAPLILGLLTADVKSAVQRAKRLTIIYTVAALLGLAGFLALLVAAGIAMARHMSPEAAALAIAGILVSASLVLVAIASIWSARDRRKKASKSASRTIVAAAAVTFLPALLGNRLGLGLIAAVAGGYVLASRKPVKQASSE
jgi:cytochrome bd-type quinol oxidase subunit 2